MKETVTVFIAKTGAQAFLAARACIVEVATVFLGDATYVEQVRCPYICIGVLDISFVEGMDTVDGVHKLVLRKGKQPV